MPIVLFDGVCNLCNFVVDFIISHEKGLNFKFASLQSDFAKEILKGKNIDYSKLETVYVYADGHLLEKNKAVYYILKHLQRPWSLLSVFKIFPTFIQVFAYDFIAKNRYRFFGKKETCRVPTALEKDRFLS
jgi:predicted DCC family thiol-disulfide oxidoreductase YuxK